MAGESSITYFESRGPEHTDETLRLARERADQRGIRDVVVASYSGKTGAGACEVFKGFNVVVVAGVYGFRKPNEIGMLDENRMVIEAAGAKLLFTGHAFGMLGRAVHKKLGAVQIDEIVAHVLRLFGAGVKVGCEITCMAADAGLVKAGSEVIAIAGTATGADSAIVIRASNTHTFFESRILEIICKPRD
ncbi:MAG: pyruvate kinase alpha/beta domain-containing protein [bacterium]|jgi:hypothetical protein